MKTLTNSPIIARLTEALTKFPRHAGINQATIGRTVSQL